MKCIDLKPQYHAKEILYKHLRNHKNKDKKEPYGLTDTYRIYMIVIKAGHIPYVAIIKATRVYNMQYVTVTEATRIYNMQYTTVIEVTHV